MSYETISVKSMTPACGAIVEGIGGGPAVLQGRCVHQGLPCTSQLALRRGRPVEIAVVVSADHRAYLPILQEQNAPLQLGPEFEIAVSFVS